MEELDDHDAVPPGATSDHGARAPIGPTLLDGFVDGATNRSRFSVKVRPLPDLPRVDGVLVGISGQDEAIYKGLAGSGIPYISSATAAPGILLGEGAFVFANPIGGNSGLPGGCSSRSVSSSLYCSSFTWVGGSAG